MGRTTVVPIARLLSSLHGTITGHHQPRCSRYRDCTDHGCWGLCWYLLIRPFSVSPRTARPGHSCMSAIHSHRRQSVVAIGTGLLVLVAPSHAHAPPTNRRNKGRKPTRPDAARSPPHIYTAPSSARSIDLRTPATRAVPVLVYVLYSSPPDRRTRGCTALAVHDPFDPRPPNRPCAMRAGRCVFSRLAR